MASCILFFLLLLPLSAANHSCSTSGPRFSMAVYSNHPNTMGACGYGEYGATINGGMAAGAVRLYRIGRGCGACYRVRCTEPHLCDPKGVAAVVTDQGFAAEGVEFVLSPGAFAALAYPGRADDILYRGIVAVEYSRVSCEYPKKNLQLKIMEQSKNPGYLAIIFLYQGGKYDILDVQLLPYTDGADDRNCEEWMPMRRTYGTVWDLEDASSVAMKVKLLLSSDDGKMKWVNLGKSIPKDWKHGRTYDTGIQLSSIPTSDSS